MLKTKKSLVTFILVAVVLLIASIAIGITGAYYQTSRKSVGTVILDQGLFYTLYNISVDDNENLISEGSILYYEDGTSVSEYAAFKDISAWQNETFYIATPYIRVNENTMPFYVRAKVEYIFYCGEDGNYAEITNATVLADLTSQLFNGGTQLDYSSKWVEKDGWYYYVEDKSAETKKMDKIEYGDADIFLLNYNTAANDNYYSVLKTGRWDALYGGPETVYNDETIKLSKMSLRFTIETIQASGVSTWAGETFTTN